MARLPCSVGPHAHPFRNRLSYVHYWNGVDQVDKRLRLCPTHFPDVEHDLSQFKWDAEDLASGGNGTRPECLACLKPVDKAGWHLTVTSYPSDNQREDYSARLHIDCRFPSWIVDGIDS